MEDIKQYANEIICFYLYNDPYVKYEVEKDFADKITTEQILNQMQDISIVKVDMTHLKI